MNKSELKKQLMRLYEKYGVSTSVIEILSEEETTRGAKGYLATLTNEKNRDYDEGDSVVVKDIFYYFG
jgi:hypothetical protein